MLTNEIGETAGLIWRHLDKNGEMSLPELKKSLDLSERAMNWAIGWLAREEQIAMCVQGRNKVVVALKSDN